MLLHNLNILLVAPSLVLLAALKKELGELGVLKTVCTHTLQDALNEMRQSKPDLVLSSMYFADGDATSLIKIMRQDDLLKDVLFMLISSESRFEMLDPIRQAGVVAILPRPFTPKALEHAVYVACGYLSDAIQIESASLHLLKLLVVDDSRLARQHILTVLSRIGIRAEQIIQAENGETAIKELQNATFDVVLTDYNMPHMDGEELLKYIRLQPNLASVPVIMITSEQKEAALASIKSHGVTALLDKPFTPDNLKRILESHLA